MKKRQRSVRKLLIASVGVATVSFVGIGCSDSNVGNLLPLDCSKQDCSPAGGSSGSTGASEPQAGDSSDAGAAAATDAGSGGSADE